MMKKVLIHGENSVTKVAPEYVNFLKSQNSKITDGEIAQAVADHLGISSFELVDESDLPDRYFREAWAIKNKKMSVDLDKARDVQMKRIRKERDKKLAALDVETLKGNDVQAEKQVLRDLPETVDLSKAKSLTAIKSTWPDELK